MHMRKKRKKTTSSKSLYDVFCLGDRVTRIYSDDKGTYKRYQGIILAIDSDSVKVFWDKVDGKSRYNGEDIGFDNCSREEIFYGNDYFSPIKREY